MATAQATGVLIGEPERVAPRIGPWRRIGIIARQNPLGVFGFIIAVMLCAFAAIGPMIEPYDPADITSTLQEGPSADHWFGTDHLGRDMLSRVIHGARVSIVVGVVAVALGTALGTGIGIISGYARGGLDGFIQRTADMAIAFPALLLLLVLRQIMGPHLHTLIIAIGIAIIPGVTRVVRGAVLSESNNQYVEAARALGASTPRILFIHILPNVVALSIIIMTSLIGTAILAEAALSFLGIGIPSSITWGQDVSDARNTYPFHVAQAFFPGAAITLTVLGFNLLGDSLRDIFDPRLRGRL